MFHNIDNNTNILININYVDILIKLNLTIPLILRCFWVCIDSCHQTKDAIIKSISIRVIQIKHIIFFISMNLILFRYY
jgi:hypothetical protein